MPPPWVPLLLRAEVMSLWAQGHHEVLWLQSQREPHSGWGAHLHAREVGAAVPQLCGEADGSSKLCADQSRG